VVFLVVVVFFFWAFAVKAKAVTHNTIAKNFIAEFKFLLIFSLSLAENAKLCKSEKVKRFKSEKV
jgi:hypothetical protein